MAVRRAWTMAGLRGRVPDDHSTYYECSPTLLPAIPAVDTDLRWLEAVEPDPTSIVDDGPDAYTKFTAENLARIANGSPVPLALSTLAGRPELQRRIPTVTSCYLDLAHRMVPTDADGHLLHFLSDQQWCVHWYVHLGGPLDGHVLSSPNAIGFDLGDDDPDPNPPTIPVDSDFPIAVAETSVERFLYRFWVENALWLVEHDLRPSGRSIDDYARLIDLAVAIDKEGPLSPAAADLLHLTNIARSSGTIRFLAVEEGIYVARFDDDLAGLVREGFVERVDERNLAATALGRRGIELHGRWQATAVETTIHRWADRPFVVLTDRWGTPAAGDEFRTDRGQVGRVLNRDFIKDKEGVTAVFVDIDIAPGEVLTAVPSVPKAAPNPTMPTSPGWRQRLRRRR